MRVCALIVAAGRGSRASGAGAGPKQYADLAGRPLIAWTMAAFAGHPRIDCVQVVIHRDDEALYRGAAPCGDEKIRPPVMGGQTRQASVLAGLEAIAEHGCDVVLVHDAARPFVDGEIIERVLSGVDQGSGCIAAVQVADTLKRSVDGDGAGVERIAETIPRSGLWRAQTPQGFAFQDILEAHRAAAVSGLSDFTDDASIAEWAGLSVRLVEGSVRNDKITTAEDLVLAQGSFRQGAMEPRTGTGFDVHRFGPGSSVWLCGVEIPFDRTLVGHSDADVGLHALTDAILGALGDGDIGAHFPPSDPQWLGARSDIFLKDAARRVAESGSRIANVDITLICEAPKIGPHREAMRAAIAEILGVDIARVGVKATTTEGLGLTGRREGIAAIASAMLLVPIKP